MPYADPRFEYTSRILPLGVTKHETRPLTPITSLRMPRWCAMELREKRGRRRRSYDCPPGCRNGAGHATSDSSCHIALVTPSATAPSA